MAVAVSEEVLDGFRGGLAARRAAVEFGEEQWAKLHGFVVEDGGVLRSQWPLQEIMGIEDVVALGVYQGPGETPFLVAVQGTGEVKWREAPPDGAESGSTDLSATWHPLLNESGVAISPGAGVRPLTSVPLETDVLAHADGGLRPALILNTIGLSDTGLVWFVYEADTPATEEERLRAMNLGSAAKWPVDDATNASPKAEYGTLWSGVLVLGDIEWKADPDLALSETNKIRYRNGLWVSVPGEPLLFDPLSVLFIGESNTRISGLLPTEQGLLVFTTSLEGLGGVHILRGTPDAFILEPLHIGIGVSPGQTGWQDTNTYCWVTDAGEVWQSDTSEVRRLDRQGLGVDRQKSPRDGVKSFGPWLLAVRERRMFVLRVLDDSRTAAWTEANVDSLQGPVDMRFAHESGQSVYFLAGKHVYRFTRADIRTGVSERGETPLGLVDLSVGSRTLQTGKGHHKTFWHRVGIRATAGHRADTASVERIILRAGPVLDTRAPFLARSGPFPLAVEVVSSESEDTVGVSEATEGWECLDNATSIDCDQLWVTMAGGWELLTGEAESTGANDNSAYMDFGLSLDDQFAKAALIAGSGTEHYVFVRNPGTGDQTHYAFVQTSTTRRIERVVGGSRTTLTEESVVVTVPFTMELRVVESVLEALIDNQVVLTAVDSAITTGRFVGIGADGVDQSFESFEAGVREPGSTVLWAGTKVTWAGVQVQWDLTPADLLPPPTHSPKRWQALVRGIGASNEFSIEVVCQGDVQLEQVSVFFQGSILGGDSEGR